MMTNQSPLERAARALSVHNQGNEYAWEVWLDDARAVLMAIRTPSEKMKFAGEIGLCRAGVDNVESEDSVDCWQAMIDAALEDSK